MRITWTEGERFVPEKLFLAAAKGMVMATGELLNFLSFPSQHQQLDKKKGQREEVIEYRSLPLDYKKNVCWEGENYRCSSRAQTKVRELGKKYRATEI